MMKSFLLFLVDSDSDVKRNISFCVILCKAGLRLNFASINEIKCVITKLSLLPCCIETIAFSISCSLILNISIVWSILLGYA